MSSLVTTVRNSTLFPLCLPQTWSLASACLVEFLEAIRSVNPPGKWKILVIDEHSQKLLGSVLKQFDILAENVTCTLDSIWIPSHRYLPPDSPAVIESISKRRDPQPDFEAVYLLMPTTQNVDRIIRDFSQRKQYAAAHLFFIEGGSCFPGPRKQVILTAFRIIRTSLWAFDHVHCWTVFERAERVVHQFFGWAMHATLVDS